MPDEPRVEGAVARAARGVQAALQLGQLRRRIVGVPEARKPSAFAHVVQKGEPIGVTIEVRRVAGRVREVRQAARRLRRALGAGEERCFGKRGVVRPSTVVARARAASPSVLRGVVQRVDDRVHDFVHPRLGCRLDGVVDGVPERRVVRAFVAVPRTDAMRRAVVRAIPIAETVRAVEPPPGARAREVVRLGAMSPGPAPAQRRVRGHVPLDVVVRVPQACHGEHDKEHDDRPDDHDRLLAPPAEPVVHGFLLAPHRGRVDRTLSRRASSHERPGRPRAVVCGEFEKTKTQNETSSRRQMVGIAVNR